MSDTVETCCICGHKFTSKEMHNAAPVVDKGLCCEDCNKIVMLVRYGNFFHAVNRA